MSVKTYLLVKPDNWLKGAGIDLIVTGSGHFK